MPIKAHVALTIISFIQAYMNNACYSYGITVPFHTLLKTSSMTMNIITGMLFFGVSINGWATIAMGAVSAGITIVSYMQTVTNTKIEEIIIIGKGETIGRTTQGIILVIVAQIIAAMMGHLQESLYKKYKPGWKENMFFSHSISCIFLISVSYKEIPEQITWAIENTKKIGGMPAIPIIIIIYCIATTIGQRGIYQILEESTAIVLVMVLTIRKFLTIMISIYQFKHPFTTYHWIGTMLVFSGSILYSLKGKTTKKNTIKKTS